MDGQTRSPLKESELSQRVMNSDKVNVEDKWFEEGTLEDSPNDADCDNEYSLPFSKELHDFLVLPITEISVALLVLASCFLVAVETLTVERTYFLIEDTISCIFIAEYFARWYSRGLKPRYLLRWAMIIDFIAILPFGLQLTTGQLGPSGLYTDYTFLRLLRILRLQRFLRNPASFERLIGSVLPVKIQVREFDLQLFRIFDQIFTLLFITSGLIYNAENAANDKFSDFFSAFYFTVITVTTVGFGDIVPITPAGRAITAAAILVGISLIPYQLSNLARIVLEEQSGLKEEKAVQTSMRERQEFVQLTCVECGECLHAKRAKFCLGCGVKLPDGSEEQQYM